LEKARSFFNDQLPMISYQLEELKGEKSYPVQYA